MGRHALQGCAENVSALRERVDPTFSERVGGVGQQRLSDVQIRRAATGEARRPKRSAPEAVQDMRRTDRSHKAQRAVLRQAHANRAVGRKAGSKAKQTTDRGGTVGNQSKVATANNPMRAAKARPRCLAVAARGVTTSRDFAGLMSSLMSDIIEGRIDARAANAVCNAGGKLLKVVEMQRKYGTVKDQGQERVLSLAE